MSDRRRRKTNLMVSLNTSTEAVNRASADIFVNPLTIDPLRDRLTEEGERNTNLLNPVN